MPNSKPPRRKRGTLTRATDTARRLATPTRLDLRNTAVRRGSVGPQGGRPPRIPGRTGGR